MAVSLNLGTAGGELHKSITINSNDAAVPIKVLALKANVIQPIQLLPHQYIAFGDIMQGYECKGSITIKILLLKILYFLLFYFTGNEYQYQ